MTLPFLFHKNLRLPALIIIGCILSTLSFGQKNKNTISIEKSKYGMLFTNVMVNGKSVKTIIDFGDPNRFQLSETLVKKLHIPMTKTNKVAMDVIGNAYPVFDGIIDSIKVGEWTFKNEPFSSSPDEMKLISQQINTEFHAVIGWGFFSDYYITMSYHKNEIFLSSIREIPENVNFSSNLDTQSSYLVLQSKINGVDANLIMDTGAPLTLLDSTFYRNINMSSRDTSVKHMKDIIPMKIIPTAFRNNTVNISYLIYELTALKFLAVGIIGGDLLEIYNVYIEPKEKLIYFIRI